MLKLNKIIGVDESKNNILVTLEDGRSALVDKERKGFVVEILLDSFYKWMSFPNEPTAEDQAEVIEILTNPKGFAFGPLAERYLTDETLKHKFDVMKKDAGYAY